jgi:hypothetical protein
MCKKITYAVAHCLLLFIAIGLSHAEEGIDHNEVKISFTGNTLEGKIIKRDTNYKMYLHPSGKLIRLDSKDSLERGSWYINSDNELCLTFDSEECYSINKRSEGQFHLRNRNGALELTIVKVILGNPDKMKPL